MVEEIYKMKNEILQQAKKELEERGPDRMDVDRLGEMIDMVKDLAEAEKSCWEAQYYRNAVGEAMKEKYGYSTGSPANGGNMGRQGYDMIQSERQGYGSMGRMGHDDIVEELGEKFRYLSPEEKMMMKSKVLEKMR